MVMAKRVSMLTPQKLAYPATLTMVRVTVERTMADVSEEDEGADENHRHGHQHVPKPAKIPSAVAIRRFLLIA